MLIGKFFLETWPETTDRPFTDGETPWTEVHVKWVTLEEVDSHYVTEIDHIVRDRWTKFNDGHILASCKGEQCETLYDGTDLHEAYRIFIAEAENSPTLD